MRELPRRRWGFRGRQREFTNFAPVFREFIVSTTHPFGSSMPFRRSRTVASGRQFRPMVSSTLYERMARRGVEVPRQRARVRWRWYHHAMLHVHSRRQGFLPPLVMK